MVFAHSEFVQYAGWTKHLWNQKPWGLNHQPAESYQSSIPNVREIWWVTIFNMVNLQ